MDAIHDHSRLEVAAWSGHASGLAATLAGLHAAHAQVVGYATLSPQDLTAWITAIGSSVGVVTAALNGLAIFWHRVRTGQAPGPIDCPQCGRRRRRRRKASSGGSGPPDRERTGKDVSDPPKTDPPPA